MQQWQSEYKRGRESQSRRGPLPLVDPILNCLKECVSGCDLVAVANRKNGVQLSKVDSWRMGEGEKKIQAEII